MINIAEKNKYSTDVGWESDPKLFAQVAVHPKQWLGSAEEHLFSAEIMLPYIEKRRVKVQELLDSRFSGRIQMEPCLIAPYLLHCALAMENIFKSLIVLNNSDKLLKEAKSTSKTPKLLLGHNLVELANRAGIEPNIDEEYVLKFLSRYGIWRGKYHQPIKNNDNGVTERLSNGNHYVMGGYDPTTIPKYFEYCIRSYKTALADIESKEKA